MTATTTALLRLPVTSIVLVVLMLGNPAGSQIPLIMLSAVVAMLTASALDRRAHLGSASSQGARAEHVATAGWDMGSARWIGGVQRSVRFRGRSRADIAEMASQDTYLRRPDPDDDPDGVQAHQAGFVSPETMACAAPVSAPPAAARVHLFCVGVWGPGTRGCVSSAPGRSTKGPARP